LPDDTLVVGENASKPRCGLDYQPVEKVSPAARIAANQRQVFWRKDHAGKISWEVT
jgi:hypothetical protein